MRWADVDLTEKVIHVRQRADRFNDIGRPKSAAGKRTVPMTPIVANTLRENPRVAGSTPPLGTIPLFFNGVAGDFVPPA